VTVARIHFERLDASRVQQTPQGGLRAPAAITRVGIFEYRAPNGTITRELRPPEEVFAADSLSTARGAPVTDLHPPEGLVSPATWKTRSVGHLGDDVRADGEFVAADVVVQDAREVQAIRSGDRAEISMGYRCELDATPGTWRGQRYDAVQRQIRYNHAALGPRGWGRAGADVALRLDAGDAVHVRHEDDPTRPTRVERTDSMKTMRLDSLTVSFADEVSHDVVAKAIADRDKRLDAMEEELDEEKKKRAAAEGAADQAKKDAKDAKDRADAAEKPERIDSLVSERVALLDAARKLAPDAKFDGLSTRQVMITALGLEKDEAIKPRLDSLSDDYIRGRFETAASAAPARQHSPASVRAAAGAAQAQTQNPTQARADARQKLHDAWKQPGDITKRKAS
jgi:uncharacterized protein